MTSNLEQAAANLLNAINNPSPRPLAAATTCREAALDELNVHFNHREDRHVDAATVHALLEIAEQLRLANLFTLAASSFPDADVIGADYEEATAAATRALFNYRIERGSQFGHEGPGDDQVVADLHPDIAATLGVEPLDEQEQQ